MSGVARVLVLVLVAVLAPAACSDGTPTAPPGGPDEGPFGTDTAPDLAALLAPLAMDTALATISAADVAARVGALADDSTLGRLTGSRELEKAASYIAGVLSAAGVAPAGRDGYLARWWFSSWADPAWDDSLRHWPPNVVGVVRGSDPALADGYVVVTAHFDHLGTGTPDATGDSIFNGADDNASGTAALLEVAEALAALPVAPRRSVLFLAVSGEELGLLGSGAYMEDPTVPVSRMVANINLDMISRGARTNAFAIGHDLSTLGLLADGINDQLEPGVTASPDAALGESLMARSDHFHFARNRVPALGIFGGFHGDYHTRDDEADRIDAEKGAAVARFATYLVAAVAMMDEPPRWTAFGSWYMRQWW